MANVNVLIWVGFIFIIFVVEVSSRPLCEIASVENFKAFVEYTTIKSTATVRVPTVYSVIRRRSMKERSIFPTVSIVGKLNYFYSVPVQQNRVENRTLNSISRFNIRAVYFARDPNESVKRW